MTAVSLSAACAYVRREAGRVLDPSFDVKGQSRARPVAALHRVCPRHRSGHTPGTALPRCRRPTPLGEARGGVGDEGHARSLGLGTRVEEHREPLDASVASELHEVGSRERQNPALILGPPSPQTIPKQLRLGGRTDHHAR